MRPGRLGQALAILGSVGVSAFGPAFADSRDSWPGYDWSAIQASTCEPATACAVAHQKWDWKRNQMVDVSMAVVGSTVLITERLTNNDQSDDDFVCVTVLFEDAGGATLAAYHQNWHIDAGATLDRTTPIPASADLFLHTQIIRTGTRQCRDGAHEDDAVFELVQKQLGQKQVGQ